MSTATTVHNVGRVNIHSEVLERAFKSNDKPATWTTDINVYNTDGKLIYELTLFSKGEAPITHGEE